MKYTPAAIDLLIAACDRRDRRIRLQRVNDARFVAREHAMKPLDVTKYLGELEDGL